MASDAALTPKGLLVALPTLASATAISFDVGFFTGVDVSYFPMFSLSEHLLFAIEVLPLVLLGIALITVPGALLAVLARKIADTFFSLDNRWRLVVIVAGGILLNGVFYSFYLYGPLHAAIVNLLGHFRYPGYMVVFLFLNFLIFATLVNSLASRKVLLICFALFSLELISVLFGMSYAEALIDSQYSPHTVDTNSGAVKGRLLRAGERGILFFNRENGQLRFLKWEGVKEVSGGPRKPLGTN